MGNNQAKLFPLFQVMKVACHGIIITTPGVSIISPDDCNQSDRTRTLVFSLLVDILVGFEYYSNGRIG